MLIVMSGKSTATLSIRLGLEYLRRNAPRADLGFTVDSEHHEADFALAIIGDRLRDRRPLAHPEIFARRFLVGLPGFIVGLTTGNFPVRVNVDGDEILGLHFYSSVSAHDWGTGIVISSAICP